MKTIWSEFAENQLDGIYEYYKRKAGPRIAKNFLKELLTSQKS